jgi:tol-pal system protein YbgF
MRDKFLRKVSGVMRRLLSVLPLAAGALLLDPFLAEQLRAQTTEAELGSLVDRIGQVERGIKDLQHTLYSGKPHPAGVTSATSNLDAATADHLTTRIDEMDGEIRQLTGQVEEIGYKLGQLTEQFQKFSGETDARLRALEGGGARTQAPGGPAAQTAQGQAGKPVSGNSADGTGLAPGPQTLGKIPAGSVPAQPQGTYQDQYNIAIGYLRQQDYPRAEAALRRFITQHGETDLAGPAMYWLGEVFFVQGKFADGAQTFLDALKKYPQSPKAPDSMLKLGMSLAQLKQAKEACLAFKDLPKKYPNASQTILQRAKVEAERAGCK